MKLFLLLKVLMTVRIGNNTIEFGREATKKGEAAIAASPFKIRI